jgi:hypothetical protein
MRWTGYAYKISDGKLERKRPLGQGVHEMIILTWILMKQDMRERTGFTWLRTGSNSRLL